MAAKTEPELPLATSKEQILNAPDRAREIVSVPEWGYRLNVVGLTGAQRDRYQSGFRKLGPTDKGGMKIIGVNDQNSMARLVAMSVVDGDDRLMFTDADVLALGDKSAIALERVNDVAMRLSGLEAETVEALKEGLKATQNGSSGSESPGTSE